MNRLAMKFCALLAATVAPALGASISSAALARPVDGGASVTFRKVFKTSYPEFVEIKVNESGSGTFDIRQLDQEATPQPFEVDRVLAQRIFELAGKLHDFEGLHLDIHRRIANLGQKTFRYEKGGESHEVTFNYTLDESATQLLNIFEGLSRQELDLSNLQRTMRYDRLGVNDLLIQIEVDYNNKLLPEPDRLLPTLDEIAVDEKFIDIARSRARTLAGRIRNTH
jgi:hypothetical protein